MCDERIISLINDYEHKIREAMRYVRLMDQTGQNSLFEEIRFYSSSSFSTPIFFTFGFQILSGIQVGAPLGFVT